ncbi:unnamed protein product, partial [Discosporangium mesarthrocarpum]
RFLRLREVEPHARTTQCVSLESPNPTIVYREWPTMNKIALLILGATAGLCYGAGKTERLFPTKGQLEELVFDEQFRDLNLDLWKHEITMG